MHFIYYSIQKTMHFCKHQNFCFQCKVKKSGQGWILCFRAEEWKDEWDQRSFCFSAHCTYLSFYLSFCCFSLMNMWAHSSSTVFPSDDPDDLAKVTADGYDGKCASLQRFQTPLWFYVCVDVCQQFDDMIKIELWVINIVTWKY